MKVKMVSNGIVDYIKIKLSSNIAKGTLLFLFAQLVFIFTGYTIHLFLARRLGPSLYGDYSVVIAFISSIIIIFSTGIPRAASKFISQRRDDYEKIKKTSYKLQLTISLVFFLLVVIFSRQISIILGDKNLTEYIRISSILIPFFAIYHLHNGLLNGLKQYNRQVVNQVSYYFFKLFLIYILVYYGFSIFGALFGFSIAPIIGILVSIDLLLNNKKEKFNAYSINKIIFFSLPLIIFAFVNNLTISIDLFFVKRMLSNSNSVGYYAAASTIARTITFIPVAISSSVFPAVSSSSFIGDQKKTKYYIKQSLFLIIPLLLIPVVFLFSFSRQTVSILYGNTYIEAAYPLKILSVGMLFYSLFYYLSLIISGIGKPKISMVIGCLILILGVILNLLLVSLYGMKGAALSTLLISVVGFILSGGYILKIYTYDR